MLKKQQATEPFQKQMTFGAELGKVSDAESDMEIDKVQDEKKKGAKKKKNPRSKSTTTKKTKKQPKSARRSKSVPKEASVQEIIPEQSP